ncbi:hypothetical protein D3C84_710380 [compost metagenome]
MAMVCTRPWRSWSERLEESLSGDSLQYARNTAFSPGRLPERPKRWRRLATEGGGPICTTVLMLPMSIPSSRVVVQIADAAWLPAFNACSACSRRSFERLP